MDFMKYTTFCVSIFIKNTFKGYMQYYKMLLVKHILYISNVYPNLFSSRPHNVNVQMSVHL